MSLQKTSEHMVKLTEFVKETGVSLIAIPKIVEMAKRNSKLPKDREFELQFPDYYYPDLKATPWHDAKSYHWSSLLEQNYEAIKKEAIDVFSNNRMSSHPQNNELAKDGNWKTYFFYKNGIRYDDHMKACPVTASIIERIPGTDRAGRVYFSAMTPGTHVAAHCGPHNYKLRCHLGLITSPKAIIRVDRTTRAWEDGKCLVFDDSFEHEVWNNSDITRIVLIVDVWNPVLTQDEISALLYLGIPTA